MGEWWLDKQQDSTTITPDMDPVACDWDMINPVAFPPQQANNSLSVVFFPL